MRHARRCAEAPSVSGRSAGRSRAFSVIDIVLVFNLRVRAVGAFHDRIAVMVGALLEKAADELVRSSGSPAHGVVVRTMAGTP
jgi:hypothetical protein